MLGDDETQLILPPSAVYPFAARCIGNDVYLIGVPPADRRLLGPGWSPWTAFRSGRSWPGSARRSITRIRVWRGAGKSAGGL
jgi:hypothetical protein